jgi:diguanylate cyclase (GGDEF)-like protein/PAS domain S-box-containing protein
MGGGAGRKPWFATAGGVAADHDRMTGMRPDESALDAVLARLAARTSPVLMTAIGPGGFRVPSPPSVAEIPHQQIPVPERRATMTDLVVPADRLKVAETWEQCGRSGVGVGIVRMLNDPERRMNLTIVDAEAEHGVWLGFLSEDETPTARHEPEVHPEMLAVSLGPRVATITKSWTAEIMAIDPSITAMLGWMPADMIGLRSSDFIHEDDCDRAVSNWMDLLGTKESRRIRYRHKCRDGRWLWSEVEHVLHDAEDITDIVVEGRYTDISEEMAAHEQVRYREQLFRRLADSLPAGVAQIDRSGTVIFANRRLTTVLGLGSGQAGEADLLAPVHLEDRPALEAALGRVFEHDEETEVEVRVDTDGHARLCAVNLVPIITVDGTASVLVSVNDITDSAQLREELRVKATFDALTGCYNRGAALVALEQALVDPTAATAVLFIDLDNFKPVNDRLGHAVGDELLAAVADRLRGVSRSSDIVSRLGGDEFLVVCRGLPDGTETARAISRRVHRVLHEAVVLSAGPVDLSASIGVACSSPGITAEELITLADQAMYRAKRGRQGPVMGPEPFMAIDL